MVTSWYLVVPVFLSFPVCRLPFRLLITNFIFHISLTEKQTEYLHVSFGLLVLFWRYRPCHNVDNFRIFKPQQDKTNKITYARNGDISSLAFAQFHGLVRVFAVRMKPYVLIYPIAISQNFSANFRGISPRNLAEKPLGDKSDIYFSPWIFFFRARGVPRRNAKKELFSWADLYLMQSANEKLKLISDNKPAYPHLNEANILIYTRRGLINAYVKRK